MLDDRFWSKVSKQPGGCWLWDANKNNQGYGLFRPGGSAPKELAHRLSYADRFGPIERGLWVLHRCDTPACVNPDHLFLGDCQANVADMLSKGRGNHKGAPGTSNGNALLTDAQVIALRRDYIAGLPRTELAWKHGVPLASLSDYTNGKAWRHLLGVPGAPSAADLDAAKRHTPSAKITREIAETIRARLANGETGRALAREFGVHFATISDIKRRKIWR